MRALILLTALALCGLAGPALSQTANAPTRVAVVVVTLDEARQGQIKHGRNVIAALGCERFGRFDLIEPTIPLDDFHDCEDDNPERGLPFCARFYLHRALTPDSPPHVVVVLADRRPRASSDRSRGDMRALCFGRGAEPADAPAQDVWLWTDSARVHGVNDWERDKDALAACVDAALSETRRAAPAAALTAPTASEAVGWRRNAGRVRSGVQTGDRPCIASPPSSPASPSSAPPVAAHAPAAESGW